jgi:3-oxoacyl-[acyl-carrier protein] reductase
MKIECNSEKIVLITGTSRGIGLFLSEYYLERGMIVLGCSRGKPSINHAKYHHFSIDMKDDIAVLTMFRKIRQEFRRLDYLINNAAVNPTISNLALIPEKTISEVFKVNVTAPILISREALKIMMRAKFGRIINIGSMAVVHEVAGESLYTASKSALTSFSRVLAKEVYKMGITVNVISPSAIPTELSEKIDQEALIEVLKRNAIPHYGLMEDVSNSIDMLLRSESSAITGQVIYLGGV